MSFPNHRKRSRSPPSNQSGAGDIDHTESDTAVVAAQSKKRETVVEIKGNNSIESDLSHSSSCVASTFDIDSTTTTITVDMNSSSSSSAATVSSSNESLHSNNQNHTQQQQPSKKGATDDKYDRQLRLWGSHGQRMLSNASVCLLGCGPTGTETIKNLVLPGVGQITIVDHGDVSDKDLIENFFVTADDLGKSKSQVVCKWLLEINPDVNGSAIVADPQDVIDNDPMFFAKFSLIIATQMNEKYMTSLCHICKKLDVPVIFTRTIGLLGHIRIFTNEHCITESKPDPPPITDLRLANPWSELDLYAKGIDLSKLDDKEFAHVPYVVILMQLADKWKNEHQGKAPSNAKEKEEFKNVIKSLSRGGWGAEENLMEAHQNAYLINNPRPIPYGVQDVVNDPNASTKLASSSSNYWILVAALKRFMENEGNGLLPLPGSLPDMNSSTHTYVELQGLYKAKAKKDFDCLSRHVDEILKQFGRPLLTIPHEERELFCKNAADIQVIRYRTIQEELEATDASKENDDLQMIITTSDAGIQCPALWYYVWRAADKFSSMNNSRYPGEGKVNDISKLDQDAIDAFKLFPQHLTSTSLLTLDHAKEIARYGGMHQEVHNISSIIGGMASQEAIKMITGQYTPLDNTFIYNGITCSGLSLRL